MTSNRASGPKKPVKGKQPPKPPSRLGELRDRPHPRPVEFDRPAQPAAPHPTELLSPAAILQRFTERADELLQSLPATDRPSPTAVTAALRQAVLDAFRTREDFVARLVALEADAYRMDHQQLPARQWRVAVRNALLAQGIHVDALGQDRELFVVVEGEGDDFEVIRPAYVDQATGKTILSGQLRRVQAKGAGRRSDDTTGGEQR